MSWTKVRVGDAITLKRGYDLPQARRLDGVVPVVSSSGITGYHNEAKVAAPGVITGRYGTLGEVFYVEQDFWPLNTALYVRDFKGNEPRFIAYFLRNTLANIQSDKAAVPGVNRNDLHDLRVSIPDTKTQRRIALALAPYDELTENNRRRMALLEEAARLLYEEWFVRLRFPGHEQTRVLDALPEGWKRVRIGDIADCVGGGTPSTSDPAYWEDGTITWVTPTDVTQNQHFILLDSGKKITEAGLKNSSAKLVPAHAILMTSRASIGFFAIAGREVSTNQGFISVVPQDRVFSTFLLFQLSERVEEIRAMGSGSTYPEVSRGKFREFQVVTPLRRLVASFDEQATVFFNQIRILKRQNKRIRAARDLLLPRLMSGEIAV